MLYLRITCMYIFLLYINKYKNTYNIAIFNNSIQPDLFLIIFLLVKKELIHFIQIMILIMINWYNVTHKFLNILLLLNAVTTLLIFLSN